MRKALRIAAHVLLPILLLVAFFLPAHIAADTAPQASSIQAPEGMIGKLWAGTFALYGTLNDVTKFVCTTEAIGKIPDGYLLLSAGHCVQEIPDHMKFSVAEEIGSPLMPVQVIKAYDGDLNGSLLDFSIFGFKTTKVYPVMSLGSETDLHVGDELVNVNFNLGLIKQLGKGFVASAVIKQSGACNVPGCLGKFIMPDNAGGGASGSAVVSVKTHKVVGILVTQFGRAPMDFGVEPISIFAKFMAGPNQPHPGTDTGVSIDPDDMAKYFGPTHPFILGVHGPGPKFGLGGYVFQVDVPFELSDEYYYDVPVFIGLRYGRLSLVSTKEGYSVGVIVVARPASK